jgi:hypothetical protein
MDRTRIDNWKREWENDRIDGTESLAFMILELGNFKNLPIISKVLIRFFISKIAKKIDSL